MTNDETDQPAAPHAVEIEAPAPIPPSSSGPVNAAERVISLDILRGVAVLGILVMNIQSFSMIDAAYSNPMAYGSIDWPDYLVWLFDHLFADAKFITLFSALFGAGIVLMTERRAAAGRSPILVHYSRMFWLLAIGAIHGTVFWYGDVLFLYAVIGCLVYPLRRAPATALFICGLILVTVGAGILLVSGLSLADASHRRMWGVMYDWAPTTWQIDQQHAVMRGSWAEQIEYRWHLNRWFYKHLYAEFYFWRIAGVMLMGMALYRWGVLTNRRGSLFYAALVAAGLLIGLPVILAGVWYNTAGGWDALRSYYQGELFNYWGSFLVAGAWIGLVMLMTGGDLHGRIARAFAAVGRMALTNYLMHTLICTTLFYGHGFELYGRIERVGQFGMVLAIWAFQLVFSPIWLRYFRFGPMEWLWRSLTYLKIQPIRRPRRPNTEPPQPQHRESLTPTPTPNDTHRNPDIS